MGTLWSSLQTLGENRTQWPESPIQSQAQFFPQHFNFFFFSDYINNTYQLSMDLLRKSHSKHFGAYPAGVSCEYIHWQYIGYTIKVYIVNRKYMVQNSEKEGKQ